VKELFRLLSDLESKGDPNLVRFRYLGINKDVPARYSHGVDGKLHHRVIAYENGNIDESGVLTIV
jgi:hypothetical protein